MEREGKILARTLKLICFNKVLGERRKRKKGSVEANKHITNNTLWSSVLEEERK